MVLKWFLNGILILVILIFTSSPTPSLLILLQPLRAFTSNHVRQVILVQGAASKLTLLLLLSLRFVLPLKLILAHAIISFKRIHIHRDIDITSLPLPLSLFFTQHRQVLSTLRPRQIVSSFTAEEASISNVLLRYDLSG